jgi:hypothetical protein
VDHTDHVHDFESLGETVQKVLAGLGFSFLVRNERRRKVRISSYASALSVDFSAECFASYPAFDGQFSLEICRVLTRRYRGASCDFLRSGEDLEFDAPDRTRARARLEQRVDDDPSVAAAPTPATTRVAFATVALVLWLSTASPRAWQSPDEAARQSPDELLSLSTSSASLEAIPRNTSDVAKLATVTPPRMYAGTQLRSLVGSVGVVA